MKQYLLGIIFLAGLICGMGNKVWGACPVNGTASVCTGSTISLTDPGGGTWTSDATTIATVDGSGNVLGIMHGTANITFNNGVCTYTTAVTVHTSPDAITGTTSVCSGSATTLTGDSPSDGIWSSTNTSIATIGAPGGSTVTVTGVSPDTVTIVYTKTSNSCTAAAIVTVNASPTAITGTETICQGATTTLSDATTGGTWSAPSGVVTVGSTTGVVTALVTESSASSVFEPITYTAPGGCTTTATVTVNTLPVISPASTSVCAGVTTTLTFTPAALSGGTWSSESMAVATVATAGASSGAVTGVAAGSASIIYTSPAACADTATITVNPQPVAGTISGAATVCTGSSTTLTDAATGGVWSSSNTAKATVNSTSGEVSGVAAGSVTITYTVTNSCNTVRATQAMTVNSAPAIGGITGTTTVCTGAATTLTDGTTGGIWSSTNTTVATTGSTGTGNTVSVSGVSAGTSIISYTVTGSCGTVAATTNVTVNAPPTAAPGNNSPICLGGTANLTANATGGTGLPSYAWSGTGITGSVSASTATAIPVATGTTTYSLTVSASGCSSGIVYTTIVTVNAVPTATITGSGPVCLGGAVTLNATPAGGVGTYNYAWTGTGITGSTTLSTATATPASTGTAIYSVTVSNTASGCHPGTTNGISVTVNAKPTAVVSNSGAICSGGTVTLNATAGGSTTTYAWSGLSIIGSSSTSSTTATPSIAGTNTYSLTVTNGTAAPGCSNTYPTTVTVNATPIAAPLNGGPICNNGTVTLTANPGGGATKFTWSGPDLSSTTIANPTATPTTTSTYSLLVSSGSASGCSPVTVYTTTVTVNATPTATPANNSPICNGGTVTLTAHPGGSTSTYAWSGAHLSSTTAQNPTAAPTVTGANVYSLTVTNGSAASGCSTTYSTTVTVNATPTAAPVNNSPICAGGTVTFTAHGGGSTSSYTWSGPQLSSTIIANPTATPTVTGTTIYSLTVTNGSGASGCSTTYPTTVTVNPTPTAAPTNSSPVCDGSTVTLTAHPAEGADKYTWSGADLSSTSSQNPTVNPTVTSTYSLTVSSGSASGCSPATVYMTTVTINPLPAAISSNDSVCAGLTTTLTDASAGGAWSSNNTGVATVVSASGVAGGVAAGTAVITYTLPTTCLITTPFTVNSSPAAFTGKAVCTGSVTTLSDATAGGTWSSGSTSVVSIQGSGVATGILAGTGTITYTLGTGCVATAVVTVDPLPLAPTISIAPPGTLCINTMYQNFGAASAPPAGESYKWTVSNGDSVWAQDVQYHQNCLVNFTTPGLTTITLTASINNTQCTSETQTTINVTSSTTAQPDTIIYFESTLVCLQRGVTYLWGYDDTATLLSDTLCGFNANQNYSFDCTTADFVNNLYWVKTTVGGCYEKSYYHVPSGNKGVNNGNNTTGSLGEMKVYPNPAGSYLDVQFDNLENNVELRVTDIMGREIMLLPVQNVQTRIDVSGLQPSIYFLDCYLNGVKVADSRFVKN